MLAKGEVSFVVLTGYLMIMTYVGNFPVSFNETIYVDRSKIQLWTGETN